MNLTISKPKFETDVIESAVAAYSACENLLSTHQNISELCVVMENIKFTSEIIRSAGAEWYVQNCDPTNLFAAQFALKDAIDTQKYASAAEEGLKEVFNTVVDKVKKFIDYVIDMIKRFGKWIAEKYRSIMSKSNEIKDLLDKSDEKTFAETAKKTPAIKDNGGSTENIADYYEHADVASAACISKVVEICKKWIGSTHPIEASVLAGYMGQDLSIADPEKGIKVLESRREEFAEMIVKLKANLEQLQDEFDKAFETKESHNLNFYDMGYRSHADIKEYLQKHHEYTELVKSVEKIENDSGRILNDLENKHVPSLNASAQSEKDVAFRSEKLKYIRTVTECLRESQKLLAEICRVSGTVFTRQNEGLLRLLRNVNGQKSA